MAASSDDAKRFQRYQAIVYAALAEEEFSLNSVKEACAGEVPGLVTRVVKRMAKDGLLEAAGSEKEPQFRWREDRQGFDADRWIGSRIFNNRMTQAPERDRPRERLLAHGADALRTAELLAILIRVGREGESALQAGETLAAFFADQLEKLPGAGRGELRKITRAIAVPSYCQIMAGVELGRRVAQAIYQRNAQPPVRIRSSADALDYCRERFSKLAEEATQEHFKVITLDTKHQVIDVHTISVGLLNQSLVAPREVFRPAIRDAAAAVILSHNHPSGDPTPSREDLAVTRRLEQAAELIGISVLDHIIVARQDCISLREYEGQNI